MMDELSLSFKFSTVFYRTGGDVCLDKSVAQKFAIVMSMFVAAFATIFVCGNIVNGGFTSDSYIRPLEKTGALVSYSDNYVDANVSDSDINFYTSYDGNVTIIEFVDDEKPEPTTLTDPDWNADEEYLYMTTVTTTGTYKAIRNTTATAASRKTTATIKRTTKKSTQKTTVTTAKRTTASTTTSKLTSATTAASSAKPSSVTSAEASETTAAATTTTAPETTAAPAAVSS